MRTSSTARWVGPVLWAFGLAIFIIAAGTLPTTRGSVPSHASSAILVSVAPADTLWSIAARHRYAGASTAETVEAIVKANGLGRRTVSAGTSLKVPTIGMSDVAAARSAETVATR